MTNGDADSAPGSSGGVLRDPAGSGGGRTYAESLLQHIGHAVIGTDLRGLVRYWNRAAEQLFGWTAAEAIGRTIADVAVPKIAQTLAEEVMVTLRSGGTWSGAATARRRDGSTFPALVTATGLYDDAGRLAGLVGDAMDLGQAVRPLLDRLSDAVLVLTRDDRVTLVSPAGSRLFGWTEDQVLGRSFWELLHPDHLDSCREYYRLALEHSNGLSHECRVARFPTGWCWAELVITNLLDDPSARYVVCNLRDVTERHDDREQLVKLTEQLQTALTTRVVIEEAKGMIAARHGVSVDQAFDMLRRHSRAHNARLHDVAAAVVNLGLQI